MIINKNSKTKGFTLVELLVTIVLLGVVMVVAIPRVSRWISRSQTESRETMEQTLLMAARSYGEENSSSLPKAIGDSTYITAKELKKSSYLKDDLVDYKNNSCMNDSTVMVYKSNKGYTYTPFLYCEGDTVPAQIVPEKPSIGITFTDELGNPIDPTKEEDASKNVSIARVDIDIKGNSAGTLNLDGYSYSISVQFDDTAEDKYVEIYNSGSINIGDSSSIKVRKSLSEFVDITTLTKVRVIVKANNVAGGTNEFSLDSSYKDYEGPRCGDTSGEPGVNSWDHTVKKRTISVQCIDGNGSGCVRDTFVKTFYEEMDTGIITIEDNAGNKTNCVVRVHIDWTAPTVTMKTYKRNADGSKGEEVASITASDSDNNKTLSSYKYGYGTASWLNKANYPYGVYYEVTATDVFTSVDGVWSENPANKKEKDAGVNNLTTKYNHNFSASPVNGFVLNADGWRLGTYVVSDLGGNKAKISVKAPLDRKDPGCTSSGGSTAWGKNPVVLKGTCSDEISGCKNSYIEKRITADTNSNGMSPGSVEDNANNSTVCPANQKVLIDNTPPNRPTVQLYKWKSKNSSDPTSSSGLNSYTSSQNGWSNIYIFATHSNVSDGNGSGIKNYQYVTTGVVGNHGSNSAGVNGDYYNFKKEGKSTIKWRACDNLNNCSSYSDLAYVNVDTVAPTISSIGYKYRSSTYGSNDKCQLYPNSNCNLVVAGSGVSKRLHIYSSSDRDRCKSEVRRGLNDSSSCTKSYKTDSINKPANESISWIRNIFSVNSGSSYVQILPSTLSATDATSGISNKYIYFRDTVDEGVTSSSGTLFYRSNSYYLISNSERRMTTGTRGSSYQIIVTDQAGNSSTWNLVVVYSGVCVYKDFWKYTPMDYDIKNKGYFATGWVERFYIRTFFGVENVVALHSWTYYSDNTYHILPGEGKCDNRSDNKGVGCQLHGWYKIGSHTYFFNTNEFDINITPNGSIVTGHNVRACENSSYYLIPPEGGCNTYYITRWCNGSGHCS